MMGWLERWNTKKSSIMKQSAKKSGVPFIELKLNQQEVSNLTGIPNKKQGGK